MYTVIFIIITVPVAIVIFDFFDIKFEVFGNYLFWFIALALFNALLPFNQKNIFKVDDKPNADAKPKADAPKPKAADAKPK
jgi:hypothetical protein